MDRYINNEKIDGKLHKSQKLCKLVFVSFCRTTVITIAKCRDTNKEKTRKNNNVLFLERTVLRCEIGSQGPEAYCKHTASGLMSVGAASQ